MCTMSEDAAMSTCDTTCSEKGTESFTGRNGANASGDVLSLPAPRANAIPEDARHGPPAGVEAAPAHPFLKDKLLVHDDILWNLKKRPERLETGAPERE